MGGNVKFKVEGKPITGGRIHSFDITDTLHAVAKITELPFSTLKDNVLGSCYKSTSSGDIDIAIDKHLNEFQEMLDMLNTTYDFVEATKSLGIIHLLVEIEGDQSAKILGEDCNGYVQIDLMFGEPKWMQYSYFSPGKKSKYKGLYRTELIKTLALLKTQFEARDDDGELVAKIGTVFDPNKGLHSQHRLRKERKDGKGYVKGFVKVEEDDKEWNERYPDVKFRDIYTIDPDEATAFIFGNKYKAKDVQTFEQIRKIVRAKSKNEQYLINKIYHDKVGSFIDDVPEYDD